MTLHLAITGALALACRPVLAQGDVPRATPDSVAEQPELERMWTTLAEEEDPARWWYGGWAGFYGAVVIGEAIHAAVTNNTGGRINAYVNIASSGVGMVAVLVRPPPVVFGLDAIRALPERTPDERQKKAAALRHLFDRAAAEERFYHSPLNHIIGLTVNAGIAAILYFGYKLGGRALLTLAAGSVVWEAQIFTHPSSAADLARDLKSARRPRWQLVPLANGFAVTGQF